MIELIKNKMARLVVSKKYPPQTIKSANFNKFYSRSSEFMIIMPIDDTDFHNSMNVILALTGEDKVVNVLVPEFKYNLLQNKSKLTVTTYNSANVNVFNLPTQSIVDILKTRSYDILIDLNRHENLFCSALVNIIDADFKVGFCKLNSDKHYNFQIPNDKINSEDILQKFVKFTKDVLNPIEQSTYYSFL